MYTVLSLHQRQFHWSHLCILYYLFIIAMPIFNHFQLITLNQGRIVLALLLFIPALATSHFWKAQPQDGFEFGLYLFCGWAILTLPWSLHPVNSLLHAGALIVLWRFICTCFPIHLNQQTRLWQGLALTCGIYILFNLSMLLIAPDLVYHPERRHLINLIGTTPNLTGCILLSGMVFALLWRHSTTSTKSQYWATACFGLILFTLIPTFARGALICFGVLMACLLYHNVLHSKTRLMRYLKLSAIAIICIGTLTSILSIPALRDHFVSYYYAYKDAPWTYHFIDWHGRPYIWSHLLSMVWQQQTWLLGIGLGNQAAYVQQIEGWLDTVHNMYLEVFVNAGIIGLVFFSGALYAMLKTGWRNYKAYPSAFTMTVFGAQLMLLVHALFESSLLQQLSSELFLLFVLHRYCQIQCHDKQPRSI